MKKYLLLLRDDLETLQKLSPKEMETLIQEHMAWSKELADKGSMLAGDGLEESGAVITGKEAVVKDGPYIESKEMIGGYYLLQAKDMDEMLAIAKACPSHRWGGSTEVRPIMDYN